MRDKDGRVLVNAHILGERSSLRGCRTDLNAEPCLIGFLRRINKLLFHGIKPVFVFDGGAPNLKRSTIVSVLLREIPTQLTPMLRRLSENARRLERPRVMPRSLRSSLQLRCGARLSRRHKRKDETSLLR